MAGRQPGTAEERRKCTSGRPNDPFNGPPGIASSSPFYPYRLRNQVFRRTTKTAQITSHHVLRTSNMHTNI